MVEELGSEQDLRDFREERKLAWRMREAVGYCKNELDLPAVNDRHLNYEQRVNFERCLTQNFLVKHGPNYFGKRDLIYIDLYSNADV